MDSLRLIASIAAVVLCAGACGGKQSTGEKPVPSPVDASVNSPEDAGSAAGPADASTIVNEQPSKADCKKLIDHVLQIAVVAHNKKEDPKYRPTSQQIEQIRTKMAAELGPVCLRFQRQMFNCVMKATDRASYAACGQGGGKSSP